MMINETPYLDVPIDTGPQSPSPVYYPPPTTTTTQSAPAQPTPVADQVAYFSDPYVQVSTTTNTAIDTTNQSDAPKPLFGTDDPFAIFADAVKGTLGGGGQNAAPSTVYVPFTAPSSSGGGSAALIVILLALAGVGAYFYFRKKA